MNGSFHSFSCPHFLSDASQYGGVPKNKRKVIPDSIAGLENLQELYLSANLLESLLDSIGLLLNLKILHVSGNKLKALPDRISQCRSLVEYFPTKIGYELVNLEKFLGHLNKICCLPTSSLRHLDAHFNEMWFSIHHWDVYGSSNL